MNSRGFRFLALLYHQQVLCFEKLPLKERLELLKVCGGLRSLVLCTGVFGRRVEYWSSGLQHGFGIQPIGAGPGYGMLLTCRSALGSIRYVRRLEICIYEGREFKLFTSPPTVDDDQLEMNEVNTWLLNNLRHVEQLRLELRFTPLPTLDLGIEVSTVPIVELEIGEWVTEETRANLSHFIQHHLAGCRFLLFHVGDYGLEDIRDSVSRWLPKLGLLVLDLNYRTPKTIEEILRNGLLIGDHREKPVVLRVTLPNSLEGQYPGIDKDLSGYEQLERIPTNRDLFDLVKDSWIDLEDKISDVIRDPDELIVFRTRHLPKNLLFVVYDARECLVIHVPGNLVTTKSPEVVSKKCRAGPGLPVIPRLKIKRRNPIFAKDNYYEDLLARGYLRVKPSPQHPSQSLDAENNLTLRSCIQQ